MNKGFHEKLSIAVQRYKFLYDKRTKDYRNKAVRQNAWNEIAKQVGVETGELGYLISIYMYRFRINWPYNSYPCISRTVCSV